jgi:hypothetical protein
MPFSIKADKVSNSLIYQEQLDAYKEQLVLLLVELFDERIPFTEKQP